MPFTSDSGGKSSKMERYIHKVQESTIEYMMKGPWLEDNLSYREIEKEKQEFIDNSRNQIKDNYLKALALTRMKKMLSRQYNNEGAELLKYFSASTISVPDLTKLKIILEKMVSQGVSLAELDFQIELFIDNNPGCMTSHQELLRARARRIAAEQRVEEAMKLKQKEEALLQKEIRLRKLAEQRMEAAERALAEIRDNIVSTNSSSSSTVMHTTSIPSRDNPLLLSAAASPLKRKRLYEVEEKANTLKTGQDNEKKTQVSASLPHKKKKEL
ncbi:MAG: hypothetical protein JWM09_1245 [Francisellaceae bacterium]|nr:hypothetical protein [Francisellaceae bacterium]